MPIDFLDLLGDDGWAPATDPATPATWRSTRIDPAFGLTGIRLGPGVVLPRQDLPEDVLRIVFRGTVTVDTGDAGGIDEDRSTVGAGQFFLVEAGTPHVLCAGPDGVTFLESRPQESWA